MQYTYPDKYNQTTGTCDRTLCCSLFFFFINGLFLLCIYYSPWKHTSIFIYSSWQLSMEHFPLAICDFQTTFLKTRIKATEVWLLATSAGHFKYWRYGKTREFRVKLNFAPKNSRTYIMSETRHGYKLLFDCIYCVYVIQWYIESCKMLFIWKKVDVKKKRGGQHLKKRKIKKRAT